MTMRTKYPVICNCGHVGAILMSENDQPYAKAFEAYSLENLSGENYRVNGFSQMNTVLEKMKPSCPECGTLIQFSNLSDLK